MDNQPTQNNTAEGGLKYDQDKVRYELISPTALEGLAKVLTFGANKYADRNWEKGIKYSRVFGALMRHLWAWWRGDNLDPETRLSHLYHAQCCIMFLAHYESAGVEYVEYDDRPSTIALFKEKDKYDAAIEARTGVLTNDANGIFSRCPICDSKFYHFPHSTMVHISAIPKEHKCAQCNSTYYIKS